MGSEKQFCSWFNKKKKDPRGLEMLSCPALSSTLAFMNTVSKAKISTGEILTFCLGALLDVQGIRDASLGSCQFSTCRSWKMRLGSREEGSMSSS